ncbi:MAG: hypothetical protein EKK64_03290 [Neisseriaceae bacterium]|nr:MAG: hypothetical protein EKK64_03290 [Neisseriaceae bacterium]
MSLKDYLKTKSEKQILISTQTFSEKLKADLSSLILKPSSEILEVKKNSINLFEASSFLKRIKFPLIIEFEIAVKSLNPKKMKKVRQFFSSWARNKNINKKEYFKLESLMIQYEMNLYRDEIVPEQIDLALQSFLKESELTLLKFKNKLSECIEKFNFERHSVRIDALESDDFALNEVNVSIGEFLEFTVDLRTSKYLIKNVSRNEISSKLHEKIDFFLEEISSNNTTKFLTLYFESDEDDFLLNKKKELSLGFKTCIPNYFDFSTTPKEGNNIWKIKTESKYLIENNSGFISIEDLPITWIEKNEK